MTTWNFLTDYHKLFKWLPWTFWVITVNFLSDYCERFERLPWTFEWLPGSFFEWLPENLFEWLPGKSFERLLGFLLSDYLDFFWVITWISFDGFETFGWLLGTIEWLNALGFFHVFFYPKSSWVITWNFFSDYLELEWLPGTF